MPFNSDFFNIHDIILIAAIAIIMHVFAQPLYDRIDNRTAD